MCCMYWTDVLHVLDWYVACTGLMCCMYWTGVLHVLNWYVLCTGLMCCMYWTDVLYVLVGLKHIRRLKSVRILVDAMRHSGDHGTSCS